MEHDRNGASPDSDNYSPVETGDRSCANDYRVEPNRIRRMLVGGVLVALSGVPLVSRMKVARAAVGEIPATTFLNPFIQVSRFLCGAPSLDGKQASHLLDALLAEDAGFGSACAQLAAYIADKQPDPLDLQAELDSTSATFAALPRRITTAWFVGVVGSGSNARCVTYATNLMNRAVEDRLRPPSYAYGAYGTWSVNPQSVRLRPLVAQ